MAKVTVPVTTPPVPDTVAEYVTTRPNVVELGDTVALVVDVARTVRANGLVAVSAGVDESVTLTLTVDLLEVVGVPVILPVAKRERPFGKPLPDHVYGGCPPVAIRVAEYGTPTMPAGSAVVEMATWGGATVMDTVWVADSGLGLVESVTSTVKVKWPNSFGVPETSPVAASCRPSGGD